jgi:hypothetical protein
MGCRFDVGMRPQKITFGDLREMGVRGVLIYRADYHCSRSPTAGPTSCGYRMSSHGSSAAPAAGAARRFGRTSTWQSRLAMGYR